MTKYDFIFFLIIFTMLYGIFEAGYYLGLQDGEEYAIKTRIIQKGNIIQYPARNTSRKTPKPSNSDSTQLGAHSPETEKEGA